MKKGVFCVHITHKSTANHSKSKSSTSHLYSSPLSLNLSLKKLTTQSLFGGKVGVRAAHYGPQLVRSNCRHNLFFRRSRSIEFACHSAVVKRNNPIAKPHDLDHFRGNEKYGQPIGCQFTDQFMNLRFRSYVDSFGRFIQN